MECRLCKACRNFYSDFLGKKIIKTFTRKDVIDAAIPLDNFSQDEDRLRLMKINQWMRSLPFPTSIEYNASPEDT